MEKSRCAAVGLGTIIGALLIIGAIARSIDRLCPRR